MKNIQNAFLATLFCLSIYTLIGKIAGYVIHKIELLNPMVNKIDDFDLTDLYFSYVHQKVQPDTNIIIINCYKDDRNSIAEKIEAVGACHPKAIGLDIIFDTSADGLQNSKLIKSLNKHKHLIVFAAIHDTDEASRTMNLPFYQEMQFDNNGIGTYHIGFLVKENLLETKRTFQPFLQSNETRIDTSFSVKIMQIAYGNSGLKDLKATAGAYKIINFRKIIGDGTRYHVYDSIPADTNLIKNKIVLMGGFDNMSLEDKHFTPLNPNIGRSLPDMNGIEYQAQILSMMIVKDYINEIPFRIFWIFLLCYLFIFLFLRINPEKYYFHLLLECIFILILAPGVFMLSCFLLDNFQIKLEPSEFIVPVFLCGLILHFYHPFTRMLSNLNHSKVKRILIYLKTKKKS